MLWRYDALGRVSDEDASHLLALLEWHDEADEKVGLGVVGFLVGFGAFGTRCFCVERGDGTTLAFSFRHCIKQAAGGGETDSLNVK